MPDSRLERTRKLYNELNIKLPDTSKPYWWTEEWESLAEQAKIISEAEARAKIDPNAQVADGGQPLPPEVQAQLSQMQQAGQLIQQELQKLQEIIRSKQVEGVPDVGHPADSGTLASVLKCGNQPARVAL